MINPVHRSIKTIIILVCIFFAAVSNSYATPAKKMQIRLEAQLSELVLKMSNQPGNAQLKSALATANAQRTKSTLAYLDLFEKAYAGQTKNTNLAALFVKKDENAIKINATNKVVMQYLKKKSVLAMKITVEILEQRLNAEGISNPEIAINNEKGTISITIENTNDSVRLCKYLSATGEFGIYEVYNNEHIIQSLFVINDSLAQVPEVRKRKLTLRDNTTDEMKLFIRENPLFAILYPMMGDSGKVLPGPISGNLMLSEKETLNQYFALPAARKFLPANVRIMYEHPHAVSDTILFMYMVKVPASGMAGINNEHIVTAYKEQSYVTPGIYTTVIKMNPSGTTTWAAMTTENIDRHLVFTIDDEVYSAPRVVNSITAGMTEIASNFTKQEAEDIANILKYGRLPVAVRVAN